MSDDLRIIVCAKQVPDPEGPQPSFEVNSAKKEVKVRGIPPVISPYDETALEVALKIEEGQGAEVIALSMGRNLSEAILSKALGAGADKLIMLQDEEFENLESYSTAEVLASAIEKIGDYDLILTGRQAGDWESGQVGIILAKCLGIPGINFIRNVEIDGGEVIWEREALGGYEVLRTSIPALGTVTSSSKIGELRYVPVKALKEAREKPIEMWDAGNLKIDPSEMWRREMAELSSPSRERECVLIEEGTSEEAGAKLAMKLKKDGKI